MTTRKTRGGTFAALGVAASNLLVPLGLFYGARYQQDRVAKSRRIHKHRRKTRRS
jgi:hypothetical protein